MPRVVRDYGSHKTFAYTPLNEGPYTVSLSVRDASGNVLESATSPYNATSLLRSTGTPKVTNTAHPLVALYSTRCQTGNVRVRFALGAADISTGMATPFFPCQGARSVNIPVAGMRARSIYTLQEEVDAGLTRQMGPMLSFQTGAVAAALPVPALALQGTAQSPEPVMLSFFINLYGTQPQCPIAYDTAGNVLWYYLDPDLGVDYVFRLLPGGNFLGTTDYYGQVLREVDLMGNLVRETTSQRVSEQMKALGYPGISQFSHDAIRLGNGYTAVIATIEQIADQGKGPVDVLGDAVVVLDTNWQVSWVWNSFQELDIKRPSSGNGTCVSLTAGCPLLTLAGTANDWTHSDSLWYTPNDGNLVLSVRNQDWVLKLDYRDGLGSGDIVWRLGVGGDFQVVSGDPSPWFTHQHDASLLPNGQLTLFDNGNLRITNNGGTGNSRGQAWSIDEVKKTATLIVNDNLTTGYSAALGSAQFTSNGNMQFASGFLANGGLTDVVEVNPSGDAVYHMSFNTSTYRTLRIFDLYTP